MFKPRVLIGLALVMAGCGQNSDSLSPSNAQPKQPPKVSPAKPPTNVPKSGDYGVSEIPKGAQFTIFCAAVQGDFHVDRASRMKRDLIQATAMKDWHVVSEEGQSLLYYGYYRAIRDPNDRPESERAQRDRLKIDQMTDPMGNRPFAQAMFVRLDAPDPAAPPEWNLLDAKGYWTIEIGSYRDSPQRKQAAVEAVRAARAQGIEAYYFHGPTASSICIGAWAMEAVRRQEEFAHHGMTRHPDQTFMILPPGMPKDLADEATELAKTRHVEVLQPKVEVVDQSLIDAIKRYPTYAVNGEIQTQNVNGVAQADASKLIIIPQDRQRLAARNTPTPQQQQEPTYDPTYRPNLPRQAPPRQPTPAGSGRLKSFGD